MPKRKAAATCDAPDHRSARLTPPPKLGQPQPSPSPAPAQHGRGVHVARSRLPFAAEACHGVRVRRRLLLAADHHARGAEPSGISDPEERLLGCSACDRFESQSHQKHPGNPHSHGLPKTLLAVSRGWLPGPYRAGLPQLRPSFNLRFNSQGLAFMVS